MIVSRKNISTKKNLNTDSDFIYQGNKTTVSWILYARSDENRKQPLSMVFADYDNTSGVFTNLRQWMDNHASESTKRAGVSEE